MTMRYRRRIVGGSDVGFGQFPWQALVRIGASRCGGALIGRRAVVTAGHCVHRAKAYRVRVFLGEYAIGRQEPLPMEEFGVQVIYRHPYYKFAPQVNNENCHWVFNAGS